MSLKIYMNGKIIDEKQAKISIFDHGLLYGDGVFEGIRSYGELVFRLKEHIDRLYESAHTIMLKIPVSKQQMTAAVIATLRANKLKDAYIRLVVTRGEGDLGLDPRKCPKATVFIIADKIALYPDRFYKQGLKIVTVPTQRSSAETLNPQVKSLNYLNNILAKLEAINAGAEEAIMLNAQGHVAECSGDNIFIIKKGVLLTPHISMGALKGITRQAVLDIASKSGMSVKEDVLTRHDLFNADECFLSGTAAEIVPVVKIDGRIIGNGLPGATTLKLLLNFRKLTKIDGVRY
ncbi:MAG: branched-chain-amino-acid transaminase [Candidatus Omnitrophica bacterium CG10_big_fil_rev_8_21_14_0_10_43_8]|nr:MAG: branched-chain-amino-acid transaminase [Candidatus Omnitrophica bacterium CG10_big_fil_rev_8_21_14_0_10_43_8]